MTLLKKYKSKLNKFIIDMELGSVPFGETESESKWSQQAGTLSRP